MQPTTLKIFVFDDYGNYHDNSYMILADNLEEAKAMLSEKFYKEFGNKKTAARLYKDLINRGRVHTYEIKRSVVNLLEGESTI